MPNLYHLLFMESADVSQAVVRKRDLENTQEESGRQRCGESDSLILPLKMRVGYTELPTWNGIAEIAVLQC
jgi:hypothetical protein